MRHFLPLIIFATLPLLAHAAQPRTFAEVVGWAADFAALLIPLIIGLTFLYVIWGLAKHWVINGGSEESAQTGRMVLITGVIGLTVMVGLWGLVSLVRSAIFF
jgi:uncharacterized membrane protein